MALLSIHPTLRIRQVPDRIKGVQIGRQLIAVDLPGGGLWIHSPVPLDGDLPAELAARGGVRHVVGPNRWHDECLWRFQQAYPQALFHAAPGLAQDKPTVRFGAELSDTPHPDWAGVLEQHLVRGMPGLNEVLFLHPASRTLILADLAFNLSGAGPAWNRLAFLLAGIRRGRFAPSRFCRAMIKDPAAVRASLAHVFAWDFDRILVQHDTNIETGGKAALREAFAFLDLPR